ncbi:hypothetical protein KA005_74190 [bacterium]|nr:hypothetical protein [bacterium]
MTEEIELQKKEPDKLGRIHTFTEKQQTFLKLWSEKGFTRESMIPCMVKSGYTIKSARSLKGQWNAYDTPMRRAILQAMDNAEFTIDKIVDEHKKITFEAMNPFRPNQPDNEVRRKSIGMAYDLLDVKPPKKVEVGRAEQVETELELEDVLRIEEYTEEELIDAEVIEDKDDEELEPL